MELNEYQKRAMQTCTESSYNFSYMMLNLVGEVGELASKVAKAIRKEDVIVIDNDLEMMEESFITDEEYDKYAYKYLMQLEERRYKDWKNELKAEAGDILWQLSGLCHAMGWELEEVAQQNLDKLAARKKAGTIVGNGDGVSGTERTND